eukprot:scaffold2125_cov13-Prasinocladus_malaysianus.AAC.1
MRKEVKVNDPNEWKLSGKIIIIAAQKDETQIAALKENLVNTIELMNYYKSNGTKRGDDEAATAK